MNERFDGIVLFKQPYREKDALVKIFTQPFGTKMFFIKRERNANHPLAAQLIPFSCNHYIGDVNAKGLSFLKEGQSLELFREVQTDYFKQAYAAYVVQLIDAAIDDNAPCPPLYELLYNALTAMNGSLSPEVVALYVEIHALMYFGTHFSWHHCAMCQQKVEQGDVSILKQGVLCTNHLSHDPYRMNVSRRALYILQVLSSCRLSQLQNVKLKPETQEALEQLLEEIYQEFVGIRLKGKSYLKQLKNSTQLWQQQLQGNANK